ncbi:diguanylate cyclase domain-containing protein [Ornithinibacillus salinisoli]|uniref:Diguanylate cyclase domain-containing protein n=1 Tax=Ornithinibacillus salinisoli TaxID=1848459 RepID=A0ABW4W6J1_9BACI
MKNLQHLIHDLRSTYFMLITDKYCQNSKAFYTRLTNILTELLQVSYVGFYRYDDWNTTFNLISEKNEMVLEQILDKQHYYKDAILSDSDEVFKDHRDFFSSKQNDYSYVILPLQPTLGPACFLLLLYQSKNFHNEVLPIIKEETEKVISINNDINIRNDREKKEQFLLELTSRFFSFVSKSDILAEIIASVKKMYPTFTHFLLLSQDYDHNPNLPVKALEYSDDSTKRVSSQAFINGEIQIEDRLQDKKTYLYAPLIGNQGIYGVLQIITPTNMEFPENEIEFIKEFGNAAGQAIENASLYQDSKHLVSDLKLINDITHQLNSNLNLTEITRVVRGQIVNICHATQIGFIYTDQSDHHSFEILKGSTPYFESIEGRSLCKYLWKQLNTSKDPIFAGEFKSEFKIPYRSVMAIPMHHSGAINGLVVVLHEESYYFSFNNFKLIQSLVQHSTLALANTILKDQLEKAVHTDYLTKLYARSYLDEKIREHMNSGEMGTLILFDIDDFKKINDTYGHYIGDEVIKQIAEIILTNIEDEDVPARWGGEELAIYLPNTSLNDGVKIAGTISKQVANFTSPAVTLSAGVSLWSYNKKDTAKEFFVRADRALYEAKNYGKNCVVKKGLDEEAPILHE